MSRSTRLEDYRRRRHRTARRRRGGARLGQPPHCTDAFVAAVPDGLLDRDKTAAALCAALPFLAWRLRAYWGVVGFLYRQAGTAVDLRVVAPIPMTGAVRQLTLGWLDQVQELCPSLQWRLRVASEPPDEEDAYRCVFWRRS